MAQKLKNINNMKPKLHYIYNPITEMMVVVADGAITSGCRGGIAATVARIQTMNDPESITFDLCFSLAKSEIEKH